MVFYTPFCSLAASIQAKWLQLRVKSLSERAVFRCACFALHGARVRFHGVRVRFHGARNKLHATDVVRTVVSVVLHATGVALHATDVARTVARVALHATSVARTVVRSRFLCADTWFTGANNGGRWCNYKCRANRYKFMKLLLYL